MAAIRWRAVLIGTTAGLLAMAIGSLAAALAVNLAQLGDLVLLIAIIVVAFAAEFVAGYVAGRFADASRAFHGSFAALGFYVISATLLILDGSQPGLFTLGFFAFVSAVVGAAGGVLAGRPKTA